MMLHDDTDDWIEQELAAAPKTLTSDLYHYTSSESAILGILANRTIRLSPLQGTNDLWESRPLAPSLQCKDRATLSMDESTKIWEDIDRSIRGYSKVACFTQDWDLPEALMNSDALRGWAHLSMWAHYGARHTGVCLRFDRDRLLAAFAEARGDAVHQFSGPVKYRAAERGVGPYSISVEQAEEFGVDAVALHYASVHRDRVFFRKHADWSAESEFRLVRTDLSMDPFYLNFSDALTGIVLGDAFPMDRLPALLSMLGVLGDVSLSKIHFHNRVLHNFPIGPPAAGPVVLSPSGLPTAATPAPMISSTIKPRRSGKLAERLTALELVEQAATDQTLEPARRA
ncbi:MAG: DUF2971 domain-containing protein [Nocardioides sp.]